MSGLNSEQKETLAHLISLLYGPQDALLDKKALYNERTVDAVEHAWNSAMLCDERLRNLSASLVGGHAVLVKGWLRKIIMKASGELRRNLGNRSMAIGCRAQASAVWKTEILMTLY